MLLAGCLALWLAPAPRGVPNVDYWGHYERVGPGLGYVVNHDSYGYIAVAQDPGRLLLPREERQSRPLYALLGAAVGYPLTAALRGAGRLGLAPRWPESELLTNGFYWGFVLLNGLVLLASLLLLRQLWGRLTAGRGARWQLYALALVLVLNPVTKAFFWTAHQQMFAFFVPLLCLALAWRRWPVVRVKSLIVWSLLLGLLPLLYGSFVLAWPALAFGWWRARGVARPLSAAANEPGKRLVAFGLGAALFGLPTLLWVAGLHLAGTTYYNHEAVRYHQLVWLLEARHLPLGSYLRLVGDKLAEYVASLGIMSYWLLAGALFCLATRWRYSPFAPALLPPGAAAALAWTGGCFTGSSPCWATTPSGWPTRCCRWCCACWEGCCRTGRRAWPAPWPAAPLSVGGSTCC